MTAQILEFKPKRRIREGKATDIQISECAETNIATDAVDALIFELLKADLDPLSSVDMMKDIGVIANIVYAMILREKGQYHVFHSYMDMIYDDMTKLYTIVKDIGDNE